ncbi:YfcE family phosphodiesterase [Chimaeribacter californicus]|uniref:YfcE family phosphodiesterase n=1 Tax=Chimaeribacter californicus TaxID=2060067 RepID=A0A2N5DWL4_9GAMM|nr:metallophosphoesterase family protein [Chimaeribacter californicus]PLR31655.1 YfcE family phosphodiesterase [Chimaeribacter californicus]
MRAIRRLAALSDIHGNLAALEAVLADIAGQAVDAVVNLGDCLSGALQPAETADRLMALGLPTIKGNHERQLLTGTPETLGLSDQHAHRALRAEHWAWLESLPAELTLDGDIRLVHGVPGNDLTYFLEEVTAQGVQPASPERIAARAQGVAASLILCGHTHLPRRVPLADGRLVVNPGSVGLQAYEDDHPFPHQMEAGSPHARYALLERHAHGWQVEFRQVAYDWEQAAALAAAHQRPDWVTPLLTGRMQPGR